MNRVILMGRLTKDPEMRFTANNNTPVASFSIAVDRRFTRQGEEQKTDFFNIVAWSKQAEFCSKYFNKGLRVVVEGRIENRTWDDQEGKKHYATDIIAENMYFADSKRDDGYGQNAAGGNPNAGYPSGGYSAPAPRPQANQTPPLQKTQQKSGDGFYALDEEDDLPF